MVCNQWKANKPDAPIIFSEYLVQLRLPGCVITQCQLKPKAMGMQRIRRDTEVSWRNTSSSTGALCLQTLQLLPTWQHVLLASLIPALGVPWLFGTFIIVFLKCSSSLNKEKKKNLATAIWKQFQDPKLKMETSKYSVFRNLAIW